LLIGILERGYAKAYVHAASYWHKLRLINTNAQSLSALISLDEFEATIRLKHARKVSFWAEVNGRQAK
jgi:hypothetical protein